MKAYLNNSLRISLVVLIAILFMLQQQVKGGEFVLMNRIITYDVIATDAFWSIMPDASMPSNWTFPDDYYHGMIYSRYEIISVATNTPCAVGWGFFQWKGAHQDSCGELCESAPTIAGVGAIGYKTTSPATWWTAHGGVDFTKISDFQSMGPVIYSKNPGAGNGWPVGRAGQGGDPGGVAWSDRLLWFPITVRVTVIAVSSGSTFSGWDNYIPNPAVQKPTPTYGIDYISETTDKVVPSTDEFSEFPTMYGAVSGSGQKMQLTPGRDAYFRTKAGNGLRRSEIQHFDVPCRPATPKFILDKVNHRTTTVVSNEYEYSDFADMSDAITGSGTYVTIPAGTTKFFRKKATSTTFKSNIQSLNESTKAPVPHELVVFNGIVDYPNVTDTNGFYYFYYNADMPKDWTTPDNYYYGNFYMRYEIISQKTSTPIGLQFGLWQLSPPETGELHETMSGITVLNGPGSVATLVSSPSNWWRLDGAFDYTKMDLTWHMGINPWKMDLVYNYYNYQIRQENPSVWAERNTYWFPMKAYVTIVAVASGYSFSGWDNYLGVKFPTPAYTIDYSAEKTSQVISASDEYSYSPTMSPAISGTGAKIDLQPGQNVYIRTKAQGSRFLASEVQRLVVPPRPAEPAYTIDYIAEKTAQSISVNDEYANNLGMTGATTGNNTQLSITPGSTLYFRTKTTNGTFSSAIQTLEIPARPQDPVFTINYETGTTNEPAGTNILYSINSNLSDPQYGTGSPIALEPGQDLYLKQVAGSSSFNSGVSHLVVPGSNFLGYSGPSTITEKKLLLYAILVDGSSAFTLDDLQVTNGTAQNLKTGNIFEVIPAAEGNVSVVIPANTTKPNSFASNTVTVFYDDQSTALEDLNKDDLRIYPNPSSGRRITLQIPSADADQLDVYTIDGAFVKGISLNHSEYQTIDLQELHEGIYLLKIRTIGGMSIQKVVLE